MADFRGIGKVDISGGGGNYFPAGFIGKVRVKKIFTMQTRKKVDAFIVDFEVLSSNKDDVSVGETRNWFQKMDDEDVAFPTIKEFMLRLLGIDENDEEEMKEFESKLEDMLDEVASESWRKTPAEEHPMHNMTISLETYHKETQKGNDFTVHKWTAWHAEDGEVEALLAERKSF